MADAINWAKDMNIDLGSALAGNKKAQAAYNAAIKEGLPVEDAFNEALAKITDEQERANVITQVLNKTYGQSKAAYDEANKALIEYNQSQGEYEKVQGQLGSAMMPINTAITNLKTNFMAGLVPAVEAAGKVIQSFSDGLKNGKSITEIFSNIMKNINLNGLVSNIQEGIPKITETAKNIMSTLGEQIKANLPLVIDKGLYILLGIANNLAQNAPTLVESGMNLLKNVAQGLVSSLPTLIQKIPTIVTTIANTISTCMPIILIKGAEIIWELIKGIVSAIPTLVQNIPQIVQAIFSVWNAINWMNLGKNLISGITNGIKNLGGGLVNTAKNLFNNLKTSVTNIFNGIKNSGTNIWNTIKSSIGNIVNSIRSNISSVFNSIKSKVTTIWNAVKNAIITPLEAAKNKIKNIINAIKGFFNFKISWPKIPLPHFSVKPSGWKVGDLLKGSIPTLGISWYAKGGIMTKPTLFGGGEAGNEAILPLDGFYNYLDNKLANLDNNNVASEIRLLRKQVSELELSLNIDGKEFVREVVAPHQNELDDYNNTRNPKLAY